MWLSSQYAKYGKSVDFSNAQNYISAKFHENLCLFYFASAKCRTEYSFILPSMKDTVSRAF
jgi:hypothetical protein